MTGPLGGLSRLPGTGSKQLFEQPGEQHELGSVIATWLPGQRWYAGKQRRVVSSAVAAAVPLAAPAEVTDALDVLLVVLDVGFDDATHHHYTVPVTVLPDRCSGATMTPPASAVIAALADGSLLADAMALAESAATVVAFALSGSRLAAPTGVATGNARRPGLLASLDGGIRMLSGEQSNTSLLVGATLIAKLVRRLEPGPNPDAQLPAHLALAGFEHAPGLAATLEITMPGDSRPADALLVHDAVANHGDLWVHVLGRLAAELAATRSIGAPPDAAGLAELLGRRTAELHRALASPAAGHQGDPGLDVTPIDFSLEWQRQMLDALAGDVAETQAALVAIGESLPGTEPPDSGAGDRVLRRFAPLGDRVFDAARIRVHADLHLGQVLWTGSDVVFIDFEGEPGTPIEERGIKRDPLTDVAGLLRSFDYAGRSAIDAALDAGVIDAGELGRLDAERAAWTAAMSVACTDAYLATIAGAGLVPAAREDAQVLLALHVLQKALYEIRYELANRPGWVDRPLSAVTEMLTP